MVQRRPEFYGHQLAGETEGSHKSARLGIFKMLGLLLVSPMRKHDWLNACLTWVVSTSGCLPSGNQNGVF